MKRPLKRAKHDAAFKLKVIELAEQASNYKAAQIYNVCRKSVGEWRNSEVVLNKMPKNQCALRSKPAQWLELENFVSGIVPKLRNDGTAVSRDMIKIKAINWVFKNPHLSKDFKASSDRCSRFMDRHNLVIRIKTKIAQKLPAQLGEKVANFHMYLLKLRSEFDFPLDCMGNMDERSLTWSQIARLI